MKAILMSIKPKWIEKIASGEKKVEVRKTAPKCGTPFKCYIYCTNGEKLFNNTGAITSDGLFYCGIDKYMEVVNGKVVGEFVCNKLTKYIPLGLRGYELLSSTLQEMCLSKKELDNYGWLKHLYGWHISDLKIYDKPKDITDFGIIKVIRKGTMWFGNRYECNHIFKEPITRPPRSWRYVEEVEE